MGYGALALAHACKSAGKKAHIFIGTNEIDHPILQSLQQAGTLLHLEEPQPIGELYDLAQRWCSANDAFLFPPGFETPAFEEAILRSLKDLDVSTYSEIWTCAVTGTLTRALQGAFPGKPFKTVKVVKAACDLGHAEIFSAQEKYHQTAKVMPPYHTCPYTDAKTWQFAAHHAAPGALIWNTAG
jgi:hypothetical protein